MGSVDGVVSSKGISVRVHRSLSLSPPTARPSLPTPLHSPPPAHPLRRLERENELEDQRRRTLVAEGKLQEKADAAKPKAAAAAGGGAPGRADQIAMVG